MRLNDWVQLNKREETDPKQISQPRGWMAPKGFSNVVAADSRFNFVAAQECTDTRMQLVGSGLVEHSRISWRSSDDVQALSGETLMFLSL